MTIKVYFPKDTEVSFQLCDQIDDYLAIGGYIKNYHYGYDSEYDEEYVVYEVSSRFGTYFVRQNDIIYPQLPTMFVNSCVPGENPEKYTKYSK